MSGFKIGDTVIRIAGRHVGMSPGDTAKISGFCGDDFYLEGYGNSTHTWANFDLVQDEKESISKFLRENKWYIHTGSPEKSFATQTWLFEHGMEWNSGDKLFHKYGEDCISSSTEYGVLFCTSSVSYARGTGCKEIKIEFQTVVKSAKLPEIPPKKTEQQLRIEELEAIISKAQEQVAKLKEEIK